MTSLQQALKHFRRACSAFDRYLCLHEEFVHVIESYVNVAERIRALQQVSSFSAFGHDAARPQQLTYAQQLHNMEQMLQNVHAIMCDTCAFTRSPWWHVLSTARHDVAGALARKWTNRLLAEGIASDVILIKCKQKP
jgi:hypothetical protein